jgi:hypothetical protein
MAEPADDGHAGLGGKKGAVGGCAAVTGRVSIARAGGRQELVFCGRISAGFGGRFFDRSVKIARRQDDRAWRRTPTRVVLLNRLNNGDVLSLLVALMLAKGRQ